MIDINSKIEKNWKRLREYTRKHRILKRHLVRDKIIKSECALKRQKTQELNSCVESEIYSSNNISENNTNFRSANDIKDVLLPVDVIILLFHR